MNVNSQRNAYAMALRFDGPVRLVSMKISGRDVAPNQNSSNLILVLYGMGTQGADVEFTFKASAGVSFWLGDQSLGLPDKRQRPAGLMAAQGSDETIACRKYTLGAAAK